MDGSESRGVAPAGESLPELQCVTLGGDTPKFRSYKTSSSHDPPEEVRTTSDGDAFRESKSTILPNTAPPEVRPPPPTSLPEQYKPSSHHEGGFLSVRSSFDVPPEENEADEAQGVSTLSWETLTLPGRESESRGLRKALDRCRAPEKQEEAGGGGHHQEAFRGELVLVTGASGTGKTHLVESVLRTAVEDADGGAFVSGKFDLLEGREQYYAMVQALALYARNLAIKATPERLREVRASLAPYKDTTKIVLELVPHLAEVLDLDHFDDTGSVTVAGRLSQLVERFGLESTCEGYTPPERTRADTSSAAAGATARERLQIGIRQFFSAVCSPSHPVVLFLDDLQWADPASLDLILSLFATRIPGLLVVGACRDNEVDPASYLCVVLREMEAMRVGITQIIVPTLDATHFAHMLRDDLHFTDPKSHELSDMLFQHTDGNTFFSMKLLRYLIEEGEVYKASENGSWTFDSRSGVLNALKQTENALTLMIHVITKQDNEVKDTLMVASCLGSEFSERLLGSAVTYTITESLRTSERLGLLKRAEHDPETWRFAHDRIQESSYYLIPTHEREQVHLQIGRRLWAELTEQELDSCINIVVKQLKLGARLIEDPDEREQLAMLLLRAGEMAAKSSAHTTAQEYIGLGIQLLEKRHWRDQYKLSLDLYNAAAEVEYCLANFERLDALTAEVLKHARNVKDQVRAQTTRIYAVGSQRLNDAIDLSLRTLQESFGEVIPKSPSKLNVVLEVIRTKRLLRRHTCETILSLPPMLDFDKLASLRVMCLLLVYAILCRPMLAPLVSMRIVQHTLRHGLSGMSSLGFGCYGLILSDSLNDVEGGIQYGRIALRILDQFDAMELFPRVSTAVFAFCLPFKESFHDLLPPLRLAHRVGLGSGDIEHAMMAAGMFVSMAMFCDASLADLSVEVSSFIGLTVVYGQSTLGQLFKPLAQLIQCLRGECDDPSNLKGDFLEWQSALREAKRTSNPSGVAGVLVCVFTLASYFHKPEKAVAVSREVSMPGNGMETIPCFLKSLIWHHQGLAALSALSTLRRSRRIKIAKRNLRKLQFLSNHSEQNFSSKVLLLSAEISLAKGRLSKALSQYDESVRRAKQARCLGDLTLGCELRAQAMQALGRTEEARSSFEEAIHYYELWGANAKVSQLRSLMPAGAKSGT